MSYQHLNQQERYVIGSYAQQGYGPSQIAILTGRDKSTISRELRRNRAKTGGYCAEEAAEQARQRQSFRSSRAWKVTASMLQEIAKRLSWEHSPDVISGRCKEEGIAMVSGEWIYRLIYRDSAAKGILWESLLSKRKRRQPRGRRQSGRGQIPDRVMIADRPASVESRIESGHWEGDSIIGKGNRTSLVSLVERRSRYLRLVRPENRSSEETARVMITVFKKEAAATVTVDNGKEFSSHPWVRQASGTDVYFAEAYSPWQRGSNEHINGMVRRYFPKGTDFSRVTDAEIKAVEHRINTRPRKILGYASAWEVYSGRAEPPPPVAL